MSPKRPPSAGPMTKPIEKAAPIQISNVMLVCPVCNRPTRVGYVIKERKDEDALKVRVCKRDDCRQEIDR